jgi:hypothetical protein
MPSIIRATTTSGLQVAPDNSGSLQLQTNGTTTAVTIDTSQNVGIGTTSPASKLSVTGTSSGVAADINFSGTIATGNEYSALRFTASTYGFVPAEIRGINTNGGQNLGVMQLFTSGTERMRIDSAGNVLVGKTDTTLSTGGLIIEKYTAAGETAGKISVTNRIGTGQYILQGINASGGIVGGVVTTSTATSFNTSSDYRLKENIVPMTGALDKVAQLKPVTYTWKANGSNAQGFIAHELQEVAPDCVTGEKDAVDENGNIKPQGIDTSFLVATLTAAIQEQQTIINDLKARVETLEAK